eukprot:GHVQ01013920.1.p1 GENE.GHVQ01013920.1~~GHVQ01013920.1.p1  ORF type:complete len:263 (+),score=20.22 GHVQ01013920.1:210-998(+)
MTKQVPDDDAIPQCQNAPFTQGQTLKSEGSSDEKVCSAVDVSGARLHGELLQKDTSSYLCQELADAQEQVQALRVRSEVSGSAPSIETELNGLCDRVAQLQKELNLCCLELPKREVDRLQKKIMQINSNVSQLRQDLCASTKFSFRRKLCNNAVVAKTIEDKLETATSSGTANAVCPKAVSNQTKPMPAPGECATHGSSKEVIYFKDLSGQRVVKGSGDIDNATCVISDVVSYYCEIVVRHFMSHYSIITLHSLGRLRVDTA